MRFMQLIRKKINEGSMSHIEKPTVLLENLAVVPFSGLSHEEAARLHLGVSGKRYLSQHYPLNSELPWTEWSLLTCSGKTLKQRTKDIIANIWNKQ
jgi:hypothetical protein